MHTRAHTEVVCMRVCVKGWRRVKRVSLLMLLRLLRVLVLLSPLLGLIRVWVLLSLELSRSLLLLVLRRGPVAIKGCQRRPHAQRRLSAFHWRPLWILLLLLLDVLDILWAMQRTGPTSRSVN